MLAYLAACLNLLDSGVKQSVRDILELLLEVRIGVGAIVGLEVREDEEGRDHGEAVAFHNDGAREENGEEDEAHVGLHGVHERHVGLVGLGDDGEMGVVAQRPGGGDGHLGVQGRARLGLVVAMVMALRGHGAGRSIQRCCVAVNEE